MQIRDMLQSGIAWGWRKNLNHNIEAPKTVELQLNLPVDSQYESLHNICRDPTKQWVLVGQGRGIAADAAMKAVPKLHLDAQSSLSWVYTADPQASQVTSLEWQHPGLVLNARCRIPTLAAGQKSWYQAQSGPGNL